MTGDPEATLASGGSCALADRWGLIEADGADAASFLQSQLTQEVASLDAAQARLAGYCSPKGLSLIHI